MVERDTEPEASEPAVVVRRSDGASLLETARGETLVHRGAQLPVPGDRVGILSVKPADRGGLPRAERIHGERPEPERQRLGEQAEALYAEALETIREDRTSAAGRARLREAIATGAAPAAASLALASVEEAREAPEEAVRILIEADERFRGARRTELAIVKALGEGGHAREALLIALRLAEADDPRPDASLVWQVGSLARRAYLDEPDRADALRLVRRATRILRTARDREIPRANDWRLRFLDKIVSMPLLRDAARWFREAGFDIEPARTEKAGACLQIEANDSIGRGLRGFPGLDGPVRVRLFQKMPTWPQVESWRRELAAWRPASASTAAYGFIIHPNVERLRSAYWRSLADQAEVLVPIDAADLKQAEDAGAGSDASPNGDAGDAATPEGPAARITALLREWVGRRDVFAVEVPVSGDGFFGREHEFRRFAQLVREKHHVGIFGLRKMGKTSFLRQLRRVHPDDLIVYADMQGLSVREMPYVWWWLGRALGHDLEERDPDLAGKVKLELGRAARFNSVHQVERNAGRFHGDILRVLDAFDDAAKSRPGVPGGRIILAIDEVEYLLPIGEGWVPGGADLFAWARGVAQETEGRVLTVVAGANPLVAELPRIGERDNPVFQQYRELYVPPLRQAECDDMIVSLSQRMGIRFDPDALEVIYRETAGHPFLTRRLCSWVIARDEHPKRVEAAMVEESLAGFVSDQSVVFDEILDRLKRQFPLEYDILEFIHEGVACAHEISGLIDRPADSALKHLKGYQLVELTDDDRYRLRFGLLRRWLDRVKGRKRSS